MLNKGNKLLLCIWGNIRNSQENCRAHIDFKEKIYQIP